MRATMLHRTFGADIASTVAASAKLLGFLLLVLALAPVQAVNLLRKNGDPFRVPRFFHRMVLGLLGLQVRTHGTMLATAPVLYVANHSSYLDIPVLGSLIPAAFVAKEDVARWPLFGMLAKLQRTVFVDRRPSHAHDHGDDLRTRLGKGQSLILFPEGTSSDGLYVLPFKSGLFAAIEQKLPSGAHVAVQPVSIVCTELDGLPITRALRPYYAWFGDMTLIGHLWNAFRLGHFTVDVAFHAPVAPESFVGRKALALYCQQQVAHGVEQSLGRHYPDPPPPASPAPTSANDDALADA
ncbi:MAG TPA: lysophospholipid acyltransferase family protein [Alphaproteobacteria bacterium]|nr:lysophospholipid acyltransferase family protein [Alphaproteobacteria bacterium]